MGPKRLQICHWVDGQTICRQVSAERPTLGFGFGPELEMM